MAWWFRVSLRSFERIFPVGFTREALDAAKPGSNFGLV
jgi:hypothetical protein